MSTETIKTVKIYKREKGKIGGILFTVIKDKDGIPKNITLDELRKKSLQLSKPLDLNYLFIDGEDIIPIENEKDLFLEDFLEDNSKLYVRPITNQDNEKNLDIQNVPNTKQADENIQNEINIVAPKKEDGKEKNEESIIQNKIEVNEDKKNQKNENINLSPKNSKKEEKIMVIKVNIDNNLNIEEDKAENNTIIDTNKYKLIIDENSLKDENKIGIKKKQTTEIIQKGIKQENIYEISEISDKKKYRNKSQGKYVVNKIIFQNVNNKKYYFCYAIINKNYYKKIEFTIKDNNNNYIKNQLIKYDSYKFNEEIGKKFFFFKDKIEREIIFLNIELPYYINKANLETKCEKNLESFPLNLSNISNLIFINLKPINLFIKEKIFFDMKIYERQVLFDILIDYFKKLDKNWKIKFIEAMLKEKIFQPFKFEDVFSLVELFGGNFLDENFNIIFKNISKFRINFNDEETLKLVKPKVLSFYNYIIRIKSSDEINNEIFPFIILLLVKYNEKDKVLSIFSLIEKLGKKQIFDILHKKIKSLLSNKQTFIEIKDYFIYLLKYINDLDFFIKYIDNYEIYINIIEKNKNYLQNININIFPNNELNESIIKNSKNILSSIVRLMKEFKGKIIFNSVNFKKYFNNYLNILNENEKMY